MLFLHKYTKLCVKNITRILKIAFFNFYYNSLTLLVWYSELLPVFCNHFCEWKLQQNSSSMIRRSWCYVWRHVWRAFSLKLDVRMNKWNHICIAYYVIVQTSNTNETSIWVEDLIAEAQLWLLIVKDTGGVLIALHLHPSQNVFNVQTMYKVDFFFLKRICFIFVSLFIIVRNHWWREYVAVHLCNIFYFFNSIIFFCKCDVYYFILLVDFRCYFSLSSLVYS